MPLPSAEYARSKMPTKDQIESEKKKLIEIQEANARKEIEDAYTEGSDHIVVDGAVPETVKAEMRALGWKIEAGHFLGYDSGNVSGVKFKTIFSLPKE